MSDRDFIDHTSSSAFDDKAYQPPSGGDDVGATSRGSRAQQTQVDFEREDRLAAESEETGRVSKGALLIQIGL